MLTMLRQAGTGLRGWGLRSWLISLFAAVVTLLVLGWVTVLIPNPVFGREVPPTTWSYPVWVITSILTGMVYGTYVKIGETTATDTAATAADEGQKRSVLGWAGTITAWFAIGCPVCNKIALVALGYTGALTYFAPMQPYLAGIALILLAVALVRRLSGQVACEIPRSKGPQSPSGDAAALSPGLFTPTS